MEMSRGEKKKKRKKENSVKRVEEKEQSKGFQGGKVDQKYCKFDV